MEQKEINVRKYPLLSGFLFGILLSGCSINQYLPEGEYLYNGSEVKIEADDEKGTADLSADVNSVLNRNTNKKYPVLGYYPIYRWYKFEEKLAEKPEKFEDKEHWGEEPIFYDDDIVDGVNTLIENRAANEGFFTNESDWTLDTVENNRTISAHYVLEVAPAYFVDSLRRVFTDSSIARRIEELQPATRIRKGDRYELEKMKAERQRWQTELRQQGYYYLQADNFLFLADTVTGDHEVDLLAKMKDDLPSNHFKPQRIARVNVYPNASGRDSTQTYGAGDTIRVGGVNVLCDDCPLRPEIIDEAFAMRAGDLYSPERHRVTLRRLANYNTFRYIAMDYEQMPGTDSLLIMHAYMEPRLKRRFEGELGLTYNSADYFGPNVRLAYVNRNLLRGAELLRIEGEYTLAQFLGQQGDTRVPISQLFGLTATLSVPRLWLPKRRKLIPRVTTSGTVIELGGKVESLRMNLARFSSDILVNGLTDLANTLEEDQEATESLALTQLRAQFGYTWSRRITKSHSLNPLSIRFQNPVVSTDEVLDLARLSNLAPGAGDGAQAGRFDRMLVFSPNYTYTFDSRLRELKTHSFFYSQFVSANVNRVSPVGTDAEMREAEISTYPLLDSDFRYYLTLSSTSQFAVRLHGGIAFPLFSDRAIVPYFDLFSIGGPNSLRGFAPRQLGPGRTVPFPNNLLTFGGFGNLLVETSFEYRHRINALLEVALFADAGNIWTYKTELSELDTDFRTDAFVGDLALDAGIGFRFDLQFLILRIDLAQPLQTPYNESLPELQLPYQDAREVPESNLRLVVAFGYPF